VPPVDLEHAASFLAAHYGSRAGGVDRLAGGDWSAAYAFTLDGGERVIRFGRYREDYDKDRAAVAFGGPDLPIPEVFEIGEAFDGYYAVSARRHGVVLEHLDRDLWRRVLPSLWRALDAMRVARADPTTMTSFVGAAWRDYRWRDWLFDALSDEAGGRVSGWRGTLAQSPDLAALFDRAERAFRGMVDDLPEDQGVVHSDLLHANVLVAAQEAQLAAVFDWGCATIGDFVYHIAWLSFWAPWYPALDSLDIVAAARTHYGAIGLEVEDLEGRLSAYQLHIGLIHLAFNAFCGRNDLQGAVAARTLWVLEGR